MARLPVITIVGRQNVGKSSLLNALAGRRLSIVDPTPGVTRDRVTAIITHRGTAFELVDTGGVGLRPGDLFYEEVESQIEKAIAEAEIVIFLVDVQVGVTGLDKEIAARFRDKKVVLVANKTDNFGLEKGLSEFFELGFGEAFGVAAAHMRNIAELKDRLASMTPPVPIPQRGLRIAVIGKRNVGKSTFVNALAGEERVIVSEMPGTTRDAVDVQIEKDGRRHILVDTAGLRKRGKVEDSVEVFSRARSEEAMRRADVVVFMIDTMEKITDVDKRIGRMIEEAKKPVVVTLNKYDLVPPKHSPDEFVKYIGKTLPVLKYAPLSMISAKKGDRVWEVIEICDELHAQSGVRISTPEMNRALEAAVMARSPSGRGPHAARVYYVTQRGIHPPRFIVFVNDPRAFSGDYIRYLENKLREFLPFHEVPITLEFARKNPRKDPRKK
ncbi:MAG TPA: ribosome biogenesis GTPase Der [Planctomycetota bacterium]|jgi:GTP-binding protein|nr:ribosome biogenesis GTPase Der [Planctomycetota bacterium]